MRILVGDKPGRGSIDRGFVSTTREKFGEPAVTRGIHAIYRITGAIGIAIDTPFAKWAEQVRREEPHEYGVENSVAVA
ncbi:hypothetical protein PRtIB026_A12470 [Pseudomonas sp. RtIB026]|nr:hypothetical protein PRtIB026_A12470 [Pseudomonas sp. RtIB026]